MTKTIYRLLLTSSFLSLSAPAFAHAEEASATKVNRFALACFYTDIGRDVIFSYRFGDAAWQQATLAGSQGPESWSSVYWSFNRPGLADAPTLYVRFDSEFSSSALSWVEYQIPVQWTPDADCNLWGSKYNFSWDSGSSTYVDLYSK